MNCLLYTLSFLPCVGKQRLNFTLLFSESWRKLCEDGNRNCAIFRGKNKWKNLDFVSGVEKKRQMKKEFNGPVLYLVRCRKYLGKDFKT